MRYLVIFCAVAATLMLRVDVGTAKAAGKGGGGGCSTPALQWDLRASYDVGTSHFNSKIVPGDTKGVFKNGTDGVSAALQSCSGSFDATLDTGSKRKIAFNFGANIAGGPAPNWTTTGSAFINIRNLRFLDASQEGEYTTWLGSGIPSPKGQSYNFRMFNPTTDHQGTINDPAETNVPFVTAPVTVYHCPGATNPNPVDPRCAGLIKETWFIHPDPAPTTYANGAPAPFSNVGTVPTVGQFEMPFYFVISIQ